MSDPVYFLSYSRSELYYAEAVALALQKANLSVWFDLQKLDPGCNWPLEIETGLKACTAMIVIISRNSVQSPWVAAEWEHAFANGKPVYLLIFEATALESITLHRVGDQERDIETGRLASENSGVIDGRGGFQDSMKRLVPSQA